jgi:DNA-binding response OmpR family regulator
MRETIKILLIDDDEADRIAIKGALQRSGSGVRIIEAAEALQASQWLRSEPFDCVLLDLDLREGNGLQLMRDARTWGIKSPFVALTGQGNESLAIAAMKAGAADCLAKSTTSLEHLWQTIRAAVRIHQAEQKVSAADERLRETNEALQGLLDRERVARTSMAEAQRKLAFLAEASTVLGQSLDYTTTLAAVARLAVPEIADWCSIHMLAEDGSIMPLAVAHVDPQKVALAEQLQAKYPPVIDAPTGVPNVLRTGTSELYREIDDELLSAAAGGRWARLRWCPRSPASISMRTICCWRRTWRVAPPPPLITPCSTAASSARRKPPRPPTMPRISFSRC